MGACTAPFPVINLPQYGASAVHFFVFLAVNLTQYVNIYSTVFFGEKMPNTGASLVPFSALKVPQSANESVINIVPSLLKRILCG